ncbi:J domain-containing protein [Nodosilinea sp. LEGE 06152]|uniref:J domain-containing protein n=1 Tax=Nodosilinea sp. LEGE 06152 TaxID=2777966 RepID=UPI0018801C03|nr:J domain-containing protein [Nodosilinea sp. LEGE 06152]MBE9158268.1 J domain-containing protein [Nodosilinea sp. LEGE 06152]
MPDLNPKPKTHYDQLGVKPTASPQQIRRAFRDLSKLYHPDTTELPAAEATEKFQQLNDAYAILSSPDRRWAYDQQVGYSRISVMQPLESLRQTPATPQRREPANMYLDPTDRPLSAGEIFALFILGLTFVACLALVITVSLTRGEYAAKLVEPDFGPTLETPLEQDSPEAELPSASQPRNLESLPRAVPALPSDPGYAQPSAASSPKWL